MDPYCNALKYVKYILKSVICKLKNDRYPDEIKISGLKFKFKLILYLLFDYQLLYAVKSN